MSSIRIALLDDHEIVRVGVRDVLDAEPDFEVVAEAASGGEALARFPAARPDVAVLDVRLPDGSGVEVCRELRSQMPDLRCLMLTSYADDEAAYESVLAGASGYVLKQIRRTDLIGAVRTVAGGESLMDPRTTAQVMERIRAQAARNDPLSALNKTERDILELIGQGMTNRQIGVELFLAEKTVKNYTSVVLSKLGMERRTQIAVLATEVRHQK